MLENNLKIAFTPLYGGKIVNWQADMEFLQNIQNNENLGLIFSKQLSFPP
jgi:hypothetical protein